MISGSFRFLCLLPVCLILGNTLPVVAQNPAVAPMIRLIETGKLPEARLPTVLGMICKRGDEADLAFVFRKATDPETLSSEMQLHTLELLAQAARDRNLKPSGELNGLKDLLQQANSANNLAMQKQVIELIGLWRVRELAGELAMSLQAGVTPDLAEPLITTLATLQGRDATTLILPLTRPGQAPRVRKQAIATLATLDLELASTAAADYLVEARAGDSLNSLLQPFLARKTGPEQLGKAISSRTISPDIAKLALRALLAAGRNDEALSAPLARAAGLENSLQPLSPEEMARLQQEILTHGDAARGEQVFRREDLNCYKCHALGQAGGKIGPDLSPIGGTSPLDYLVNSLLLPSQAIKEAYKTLLVVDVEGLSFTGVVVDRDQDRLILRDAQGKERTIAIADIEFEKEGESLMPAGLTKFLTRAELIDLVRFLSALGKDSGYTMSSEPTIYRWRVYEDTPGKVAVELFDDDSVRNMLFEYAPDRWRPMYSLASGALPLADAGKLAHSPVIFAYAEFRVNVPGHVQLKLNDPQGITLWLDNTRVAAENWENLPVTEGHHRLLFRIDTNKFRNEHLRALLLKGSAPAAEYSLVVGE